MKDTILFGDCRDTLKEFTGKARMCVTSPPYYGLRNYGGEEDQIGQEQSPEEYIENLVEVFREKKRTRKKKKVHLFNLLIIVLNIWTEEVEKLFCGL